LIFGLVCFAQAFDFTELENRIASHDRELNGPISCNSLNQIPITWTSPLSGCGLVGNLYYNVLANSTLSSLFQCMIKNFGAPYPNIGFIYPGQCGCPNHCSNITMNGNCVGNTCACESGWYGSDCSQVSTNNNCSSRGYVRNINGFNTCDCVGYSMNDCSGIVSALPPITQTIEPVDQYTDKDDYGDNNPLFNSSTIAQIQLTMPEDTLIYNLEPDNRKSDTYFPVDFWFYNGIINETMSDVGFRLKGGASRNYFKKTWKLSFNKFEDGRKLYQQKKLQLKAMEQDESAIKEILVLSMLYSMNAPAQRYGYTQLFINEQNMGAYLMIENVDDKFLDSRFGNEDGLLYKCMGDLAYLGSDPETYKNLTVGSSQAYSPETDAAENFDLLRDFITILNVTSDDVFVEELPKIFDVDIFVRTLAVEVLAGNFDGIWNANNYYLYYNYDLNKFQYFRHDVSSSFGVWNNLYPLTANNIYTWGDGGRGYRLINRVLANQPFRDLFTYYMNMLLDKYYLKDAEFWNRVLALNSMIDPLILRDQWRFSDFGFSYEHFVNYPYKGVTLQTGSNWANGGYPYMHCFGIKEFMDIRIASAKEQLEF